MRLSILFAKALAVIKQRSTEDLIYPHPVFPDGDLPAISSTGSYKPFSGTSDKRLEPYDWEGHEHGYVVIDKKHLPKEFDIRNVNGVNLATIDIQQHMPAYCGGCWAFGTTASINDRFKMMRMGAWPDVQLNVQSLLNCGKSAGTCTAGGSDALVYRWAKEFGYTDSSCLPVFGQNMPCSDITRCMNCDPPNPAEGFPHGNCYPQQRYKTYHIAAYSHLPVHLPDAPDMITQMKSEIFARGPISCQVAANPMENYLSGILSTSAEDSGEIDHVVSVSGWGVSEEGEEYWVVRNSWGTTWGELGWFRVKMHTNALNIESGCTFGIPEWPPRVHEVDPERMFFTNGFNVDIPDWLTMIDESPWHFSEDKEKDLPFLAEMDRQQRENMEKPVAIAGKAFKYNQTSMFKYVENADENMRINKKIMNEINNKKDEL